jgi:cell division protein FtsB|tara:strand:- start:831 stop:1034 length:204 start_codon:yes stop_codon:yes gene_type:complete
MDMNQLKKNPVQWLLGMAILGIGYLYVDVKTTMQNQIEALQDEVTVLKAENKELQTKYIELAKSINK